MKIIDWYILKRYLGTFFVMILLFIPIGIVIELTEKINKILENKVPINEILIYFVNFSIYFANILFPIFLFISIIWFTSKLANNTEIVAILSSGISFTRFLRPYIVGALFISALAMVMGFYLVPKASLGFNEFRYKYFKNGSDEGRETSNIYKQLNETDFIYVSNLNLNEKTGYNLVFERYQKKDLTKLELVIKASKLVYIDSLKQYTLHDYDKRIVGALNDSLEKAKTKNLKFNFTIDDLTPTIYAAETMTLTQLQGFIDKEKLRGSSNINAHLVVLYHKYSLPVSIFILTIIAVAVSSMKRRGGIGVNLALGVSFAFLYVFLDKVFNTLGSSSSMSPFVAVWLPNVIFLICAILLLRNAKR